MQKHFQESIQCAPLGSSYFTATYDKVLFWMSKIRSYVQDKIFLTETIMLDNWLGFDYLIKPMTYFSQLPLISWSLIHLWISHFFRFSERVFSLQILMKDCSTQFCIRASVQRPRTGKQAETQELWQELGENCKSAVAPLPIQAPIWCLWGGETITPSSPIETQDRWCTST